MIITDKAQIKVAELRESNNLRLSGSDEIECYELIESDLKLPADATFTRSSVAYLSDGTQVAANVPRFEQGKFGKAILIEERTENLENPDNLNAWSGGSAVRVVTRIGQYKFNVKFYGRTSGSFLYKFFTLTVGNYYTLSAYVKGIGNTIGKQIRLQSAQENAYSNPVTLTAEYQKISVTLQATATSRAIGFIGVPDNTFVADDEIEIAFVLFEQKPYPTSFTDGIRAAESLTIPTAGVINPLNAWTLEWLVRCGKLSVINHHLGLGTIWDSSDSNNRISFHLRRNSSPYRVAFWSSAASWYESSVTVADDSDVYIAFAYDGAGTLRILVNGQLTGTFSVVIPNANYDSFVLGRGSRVGNQEMLNQLIDDFRISSIARSDEEILAAYQSNKPLVADEWTTYKLDFDDKVRITTQGQIICNELIEI